MIQINGLFGDQDHIITETKGMFSIVEHTRDLTVSPMTAMMEYYMSKMEVRRNRWGAPTHRQRDPDLNRSQILRHPGTSRLGF